MQTLSPRTPPRKKIPEERQNPPEDLPREPMRERLHGWRLGFSIDGEAVLKGLVCAALLVLFTLLQTTLFTRFRPFGAVPDLILPLVIAVGMAFREKWGAVFGVAAAFVIESVGGSPFPILPLLYMPAGYITGICSVYYFRDAFAVRALYTVVSSLARLVFTLIALAATVENLHLSTVFPAILLPELCANLLFAALPHLAAQLCFRPFTHHRTSG